MHVPEALEGLAVAQCKHYRLLSWCLQLEPVAALVRRGAAADSRLDLARCSGGFNFILGSSWVGSSAASVEQAVTLNSPGWALALIKIETCLSQQSHVLCERRHVLCGKRHTAGD